MEKEQDIAFWQKLLGKFKLTNNKHLVEKIERTIERLEAEAALGKAAMEEAAKDVTKLCKDITTDNKTK